MATLTKGTFINAAQMVREVLLGRWSYDPPSWADKSRYLEGSGLFVQAENYTRAVQMAEVFILLFTNANPQFDRDRFLDACGLLTPEIHTHVRKKVHSRRGDSHTLQSPSPR